MAEKKAENRTFPKDLRPRAKRSFGQNFLVHPPTVRTIAGFVHIPESRTVVELGVGQGALTRELALRTGINGRVIGYELDRELVDWLQHEGELPGNVEVRLRDMLAVSFKELSLELGRPLVVVGNLPYNISSQVVIKLIEEKDYLDQAVLMFQKEVAERLIAVPGSKKYGILSVFTGQCLNVKKFMDVPPGLFSPRPKVMSSVLEITRAREEVTVGNYDIFRLIVKQAFAKRRKTIRNALSDLFVPYPGALDHALTQAAIDPGVRAETVTIKKFADLARISEDNLLKKQLNQLTKHSSMR